MVEHAIEAPVPARPTGDTDDETDQAQAASEGITSVTRRDFLKAARPPRRLLAAARQLLPSGAYAATAAPEVTGAKLGFIALTDAAPLIIAKEKGLFAKYGMPDVEVLKQASWGATRDNLVLGGEANGIDGAHILTPMPYLMHTGKVTQNNQPLPMAIVARLNYDCQAHFGRPGICRHRRRPRLRSKLKEAFAAKKAEGKEVKAAMTFPGGTHDLWMRYWLAAGGIDPDKDVSTIVVPPPQMVANMKVGNMDVFCVGEPWNEQLVHQGIGFTAATTGELWKGHPEKALGLRADFIDKYPNATKAILMAVMEAQQWCDAMENKDEMAAIIGKRQWMNVPTADIIGRLKGDINYGNGRVATGDRSLHEVLEGRRVLPVQEPRQLVPRREHPLGQVRARHRHQGAGRSGQPRGPVARGGQGSRRRRSRHSGIAIARRRDLLRRQDLRSGQPVGLSRQPAIKASA